MRDITKKIVKMENEYRYSQEQIRRWTDKSIELKSEIDKLRQELS